MKRLLVALLLVWSAPSFAAIAYDSSASATTQTTPLDISYSVTVVSGTDNICVVGVSWRRTTVGAVSSVTIGGSAATFIVGHTETIDNVHRAELWYRKNVGTGSKTIDVVLDGGSADSLTSGAICFTGVNQTTPLGTSATNQGDAGSTATVNVTTVANDMVVDSAIVGGFGATLTVGSNQTQRYNLNDTWFEEPHAGSHETATGTTTTMSWTKEADAPWIVVAVPLKPAVSGTTRRSLPLIFQ